MRYLAQVFLVLVLVIEAFAGYAQTPEAQSAPSVSGVSSPSTSRAPQTTESIPAQTTTADSLPSTPQTNQAPDSPPPAAAPPPKNTTKAKRKRGHLSGFAIGITVASGVLLYVLLHMDGG
jgi:hypothetical protein